MSNNRNRLCIMTGEKDHLDNPEPMTLCGHKMDRYYLANKDRWDWVESVFEDAGEAIRYGMKDTRLRLCESCGSIAIDVLNDLMEDE